ncbi:MAG: porin family protein [Pseudomonadota bacterium]
MKKIAVAALLVAPALAPAALAESDLYVTGGYSAFDGDGATLGALTVRGGLSFHENFGAELEGSFGIGAEDLDSVPGAEIELENQFGGFLVGRFPVADQIDILGRVGYTTGEFQASNNGVSGDADVDGFAFGIGGEYMFTEQFGIRGDYTRIEADDDDLDGGVDVFSIAGVFKFGGLR